MELVVPYVPTDENPADFFTKPVKGSAKFFAMRAIIMNEPHRVSAALGTGARGVVPPHGSVRRCSLYE